jgi:hypothetical protein
MEFLGAFAVGLIIALAIIGFVRFVREESKDGKGDE